MRARRWSSPGVTVTSARSARAGARAGWSGATGAAGRCPSTLRRRARRSAATGSGCPCATRSERNRAPQSSEPNNRRNAASASLKPNSVSITDLALVAGSESGPCGEGGPSRPSRTTSRCALPLSSCGIRVSPGRGVPTRLRRCGPDSWSYGSPLWPTECWVGAASPRGARKRQQSSPTRAESASRARLAVG